MKAPWCPCLYLYFHFCCSREISLDDNVIRFMSWHLIHGVNNVLTGYFLTYFHPYLQLYLQLCLLLYLYSYFHLFLLTHMRSTWIICILIEFKGLQLQGRNTYTWLPPGQVTQPRLPPGQVTQHSLWSDFSHCNDRTSEASSLVSFFCIQQLILKRFLSHILVWYLSCDNKSTGTASYWVIQHRCLEIFDVFIVYLYLCPSTCTCICAHL